MDDESDDGDLAAHGQVHIEDDHRADKINTHIEETPNFVAHHVDNSKSFKSPRVRVCVVL